MKNIYSIFIIILCLFIISYSYLSFPDLTLSYDPSIFQVSTYSSNPNQHLRNYSLEYNFEKEKGDWNFLFYGADEETDILSIDYPSSLTLFNWSITPLYINKSDLNVSCFISNVTGNEYQDKYLYCNFEKISDNQVSFHLEFKGNNFYPNGLFIFRGIKDTTPSFYTLDTEYHTFVKFNLGSKYRCGESCFINEWDNTPLSYYIEKTNLIIYIPPKSESKKIDFARFRLNMNNHKKEILYGIGLAFWVSLLAGIIVLSLEWIGKLRRRNFRFICS